MVTFTNVSTYSNTVAGSGTRSIAFHLCIPLLVLFLTLLIGLMVPQEAFAAIHSLSNLTLTSPKPATPNALIVTSTADSGPGSLRQAIANAMAGDTIIFAPDVTGVITLTSGQLVVDKDLTVTGPGSDALALDGNYSSGILRITTGRVNLASLQLRHGTTSSSNRFGADIENHGMLTITSILVSDTSDFVRGSSVIFNDGTLVISNSVITHNTQQYFAGGIENSGTLVLLNSLVTDNRVLSPLPAGPASAGGILSMGQLLIRHSGIANNSAPYQGGGIWIYSGTAVIDDSDISGNSSSVGGGILVGGNAALTLTNSTLRGNSVGSCCGHYGPNAGFGGGLYNRGSAHLSNVTVSGNTAASLGFLQDGVDEGGGIGDTGALWLNNVTISNNTAEARGGINFGGLITMQNTIVADNHAPTSPDCGGASPISMGFNLIGSTSGCTFTATVGDLVNINPVLFPLIGSPAVHPIPPGSPAINAGNPGGCMDDEGNLLLTDERDVARVGRCDIGAYEFDPTHNPLLPWFLPLIRR